MLKKCSHVGKILKIKLNKSDIKISHSIIMLNFVYVNI